MSTKAFIILIVFSFGNGIPLESDSQDLGKFFTSPNRIVGGITAPEGFAPHMAALVVGFHYTSLVCGGSIVTNKLILTAAHCIDIFVVMDVLMPTFHGVVGSNYWNSPGNAVQFAGHHIHPKYDWFTIENDIGFLVLDRTLLWSSTVKPIALNLEMDKNEQSCYVTGWGYLQTWPLVVPDALQLLFVNTISHKKCVEGINAAGIPGLPLPPLDCKTQVCTFHSPGHGMCNGDSGSALVCDNKQVGIVSWGFPCAIGAPDVFVRVSGFTKYIKKIKNLKKKSIAETGLSMIDR